MPGNTPANVPFVPMPSVFAPFAKAPGVTVPIVPITVALACPKKAPTSRGSTLMICVMRRCSAETVAKLGGVTEQRHAAVAGIRRREDAPVGTGRHTVEVKERLSKTRSEPGPLDEGAVGAECVRRRVSPDVVHVDANGDIPTGGAPSRLFARIRSDVTTSPEDQLVGRPHVGVAVERTPGQAAVSMIPGLGPHIATDLDAHIGARHVVETRPVEAADLHVFRTTALASADLAANSPVKTSSGTQNLRGIRWATGGHFMVPHALK